MPRIARRAGKGQTLKMLCSARLMQACQTSDSRLLPKSLVVRWQHALLGGALALAWLWPTRGVAAHGAQARRKGQPPAWLRDQQRVASASCMLCKPL